MLATMLRNKMNEEGISTRVVAGKTGISHTTVHRILNGGNADIPTINALCDWLGVSVSDVMDDNAGQSSVAQKIAIIISAERRRRHHKLCRISTKFKENRVKFLQWTKIIRIYQKMTRNITLKKSIGLFSAEESLRHLPYMFYAV